MKGLRIPAITLSLMVCIPLSAIPAEKSYSPSNADEVQIISLALGSEVRANNWTKNELICLSIEYKDPDTKLVKTLRQHGSNVCKLSEWRKNFACGFHVNLRFLSFDTSRTARLHAEVADFRDVNSGSAHVGGRIRDGEYILRKIEENWSIGDYLPSK